MYIHLSHQHDWHHFIDTTIQLYRIVGPGIKQKSVICEILEMNIARLASKASYIAATVLLKRTNLSFVLKQVMTDAYGSLHFSARLFC